MGGMGGGMSSSNSDQTSVSAALRNTVGGIEVHSNSIKINEKSAMILGGVALVIALLFLRKK